MTNKEYRELEGRTNEPTCFEMGYGWDCPFMDTQKSCEDCQNEWLNSEHKEEL